MGLRSTAMSDYTTIVGLNDGVEGGGNWIKPNMAKLCIALGLFCGTMLFASIPVLLSRRSHSRRFMVRHVLTGLSCLGGGVFLATCFLHLIPEATEKMDNALVDAKIDINLPLPYAIIIAGFLLVLILEQFIHSCSGMDHSHSHGPRRGADDLGPAPVPNYGTIHREAMNDSERQTNREVGGCAQTDEALRLANEGVTVVQNDLPHPNSQHDENDVDQDVEDDDAQRQFGIPSVGDGAPTSSFSSNYLDGVLEGGMNKPVGQMDDDEFDELTDEEDRMTAVSMHGDPGSHSAFRAIVMVFALSLHSIFEGIAIGLRPTTQQVVQLFGAIVVHKCVIAVTLATNLVSSVTRMGHIAVFSCLAVFAAMAPIGIGIAIGIDSAPAMVNGVLQCIAAGTFVYITFFEILPHELNSRHTGGSRLFRIFMVLLGIGLIIGLMLTFPDQD